MVRRNLDRLFDVRHRSSDQRRSKEERCFLASRGEPFQVVGTTNW